jgi:predicted dehydrogenase
MPLRLGIIGLVHDHLWWYLDSAKAMQDARIVCAADPSAALRDRIGGILGLAPGSLHADYRRMLEKEKLDACLVFTENSRHAEVAVACASRGIHAMVEKPMASSLADADRMLAAAKEGGARLMVNYPLFHQPFPAECRRIIERGDIGRVWLMRFATGHSGPEEFCSPEFLEWLLDPARNGGGALQDFGTYGAALFAWYFGRPDRVSAVAGTFVKEKYAAEDHAIISVVYDSARIIGSIEGTWASRPGLMAFSAFGEKGSIFNSPDGTGFKIKRPDSEAPMDLAMPDLGKWEDRALPYFVARLMDGAPFEGMTDARVARDAQEILDAAKLSIRERREVRLPGSP